MLRVAADEALPVQVPAGAIGQAWRDGSRQVLLARALRHCDEISLDPSAARASGALCAQTGTADVIDASVALVAAGMARAHEPVVLTSDPGDLSVLLSALGAKVRIEQV